MAYIIGSWDDWETFIPLVESNGVYSYTFDDLEVGLYEYKGVMWFDDEEVSWDDCVEIIPCNGENAILNVGSSDKGKKTIQVELAEKLPERYQVVTTDVPTVLTFVNTNGYSSGITSDWTDCEFTNARSTLYVDDGKVDGEYSYDYLYSGVAIEQDEVETSYESVSRVWPDGYGNGYINYYDGKEGLLYQDSYYGVENNTSIQHWYSYAEYSGTLDGDFLYLARNLDTVSGDWLNYYSRILDIEGLSMTGYMEQSQYGDTHIYVIYDTVVENYVDWIDSDGSSIVYDDYATLVLDVNYDYNGKLVSYTYDYEEYVKTTYTGYYEYYYGVSVEEYTGSQHMSMTRFKGKIEEPAWLDECFNDY